MTACVRAKPIRSEVSIVITSQVQSIQKIPQCTRQAAQRPSTSQAKNDRLESVRHDIEQKRHRSGKVVHMTMEHKRCGAVLCPRIHLTVVQPSDRSGGSR